MEGSLTPSFELEEELHNALLRLPERYREAVVLRHLLGMSYPEVARALGIARVETAQTVVSRGIKRLRALLCLPNHLADGSSTPILPTKVPES